ncbi:DUF945 domain-containing protein [Peribacillus glennii]|uniref:DUF945 domain-containing protein n=1 Tax=Peribacillus glennii TaxID=2303991 RepID=UPI00115F255E|nr:DUF945 domain-containing protein [Peribacillus glennii]
MKKLILILFGIVALGIGWTVYKIFTKDILSGVRSESLLIVTIPTVTCILFGIKSLKDSKG